MKTKLIFSLAFLFAGSLMAQVSPNINYLHFNGVPSGSCSGIMQAENDLTGFLYTCKSGAWFLAGGGSTTPGGSNTQLQYNNSGAFGGISGWTTNGTTDVTGNVLNLTTLNLPGGGVISGVSGSITATAGGTNQNVSIKPSGTGQSCLYYGDGVKDLCVSTYGGAVTWGAGGGNPENIILLPVGSASNAKVQVGLSSEFPIDAGAYERKTQVMISDTAPTISSGFGTTPTIPNSNGTAAFTINVGTGGTATTGVLTMPAATTRWVVKCTDVTTQSSTVDITKQIGVGTATSVTIGNFTDLGAAGAWAANDILACTAMGY